jgi:hypothetical protein
MRRSCAKGGAQLSRTDEKLVEMSNDAFDFLRDYGSQESLQSHGESLGEEDHRTVVDLLITGRTQAAAAARRRVGGAADGSYAARGRAQEVVVVTGFNGRAVVDALDGLPLPFQFNPRHGRGR